MMMNRPKQQQTRQRRRQGTTHPTSHRLVVVLAVLCAVVSAHGIQANGPLEITTGAVDVAADDDARTDDAAVADPTTTTLLTFDPEEEEEGSNATTTPNLGIIYNDQDDDNNNSNDDNDDDTNDDDNDSQGIVGGVATNGQQDAPFFVRGEYGCGAALIAPDIVLGAAHCSAFYGSKVLVGAYQKDSTSGGLAVYRSVKSNIKVHPLYQASGSSAPSYDMVLFKIESVQSYPNLRPIMLNSDASGTSPGSTLTMIGFGYTNWNQSESSALLKANVTALSNTECERRYGRKSGFFDNSVTCTMSGIVVAANGTSSTSTTAGTTTSCFGDSGGPLVDATGKLVGIISFGTKYCDPKYPSGSMNVASAMPWIIDTACKLTDVQLPYCPTRTASPTRAPVLPPQPAPAPTQPRPAPTKPTAPAPTQPRPTQPNKSPSTPASTARTCLSVPRCGVLVKQQCGCPTRTQPKTLCFKRAVKRQCCSKVPPSQIRTAYYLQAQLEYRAKGCGLAS